MDKPIIIGPDGMEYYEMLDNKSQEAQQIKGCESIDETESK